MLFFIVFVLFSALILRLGIVQIVYGDDFKREVERTEDVTVHYPVPRGKMYDRNGKVIVDNIPLNAITYTRYQGTKVDEILEVSERLSELIAIDSKVIEKIPVRDKKDYWILKHPTEASKKVSKKEKEKLKDKEVYKLQLERITDEEIGSLSAKDLKILAIFRECNRGYALTPQIVKNEGVTADEIARVSENLESLPGVDTTTDWKREYPFVNTLKSVLGKVTTSAEGIPLERKDYFLSRDYSQNDRVGKSYIEMQYEDVLTGQKTKVKNQTDKAGNIISSEVVSEGKRGKDLVLSIDMDLQIAVEKIIEEQLREKKKLSGTYLLDRAYVVLMDPNTGEVLTMAGKRLVKDPETGQEVMQDDALGNITTSYNVGSAVKGATVLTGYQTGAIQPGTVFVDRPLQIAGLSFKSWSSSLHGAMNDITALKRSSNVYMGLTAIKIGKGNYVPNAGLRIDFAAFDTIRNSFAQFGLGVRTGIDLPNETIGFKGPIDKTEPGRLLFLSIGQFDTYSNMQLAQYVSTIANGGKRLQPHIVKSINEPVMEDDTIGPISTEITPTILNRLPMEPEWIERVQEGFRQVMQAPGGTAVSFFGSKPYSPAGKTGTAEAFYDGPKRSEFGKEPPATINLTLVGYAPHDNPEVAMAVLVPWAYQGGKGHYINNQIGAAVMDTYFNLKAQREAQTAPDQTVTGETTQDAAAQ